MRQIGIKQTLTSKCQLISLWDQDRTSILLQAILPLIKPKYDDRFGIQNLYKCFRTIKNYAFFYNLMICSSDGFKILVSTSPDFFPSNLLLVLIFSKRILKY
jgi:hypothetical protein